MTNLEAARIMMEGSRSSTTPVNKLIIANGTYTPDSGQMWDKVKVDIDRYYTNQYPMNYNWDLYRHLINQGHGYHFKMGNCYHVLMVADGKFYPYMQYRFRAETNTDPRILQTYFVSWLHGNDQGYRTYPSMFFIIYENGNNIPLMITQNPFWDNNLYWELREEYQLTDNLDDGVNVRAMAGQPYRYIDPPTAFSYTFMNYYPHPGTYLPPSIKFNYVQTQVQTYYPISCYHIDGSVDPPTETTITPDITINVNPPFYYTLRWHSLDPEKLMFHYLRMQTDIDQHELYTGDYP